MIYRNSDHPTSLTIFFLKEILEKHIHVVRELHLMKYEEYTNVWHKFQNTNTVNSGETTSLKWVSSGS